MDINDLLTCPISPHPFRSQSQICRTSRRLAHRNQSLLDVSPVASSAHELELGGLAAGHLLKVIATGHLRRSGLRRCIATLY